MALRAVEHIFTGSTSPIASYDYTKTNLGTLMTQRSGPSPVDSFVGPRPAVVARPMEESTSVAMMYPHALTISSNLDWAFLLENTTAGTTRRIFLYEYSKAYGEYNWKGFITATLNTAATHTNRGFRAFRYLHTTGTVGVAAPSSYYATGTAALATTGVVTGTGTTFTAAMVGMCIGFGSTNPAAISCWYPITTFTSTTSITVSAAASAITATNYVIAQVTVTGSSTQFVTERIAAGTGATSVAGGGGPRIGFGSTDPNQITTWYQIGAIASNTSLTLTTSPGVIATGTPYVIEELRFAITATHATATNGGLFVLKGASYLDFTTAGTTFPSIATNVDNQRGVYWLKDAGTVTNTAAGGCAVKAETSKTTHYAYVIDGAATTAKVFRYNLRANDAVTAGAMTMAGANIVSTGSQTGLTGNLSQVNNGRIGTLTHGPSANTECLYFVTTTRLYSATVSSIDAGGSTTFAINPRQEIPPGGVATYAQTGALSSVEIADAIDRLIILSSGATGFRHYVTTYPTSDGDQFTHIWGVDDKQQDASFRHSDSAIHFNTTSQVCSVWSENGIAHIVKNGATNLLNFMYALPLSAHWTYASSTNQRVITPSISTPNVGKYIKLQINQEEQLGSYDMGQPLEPVRAYYRTSDITTNATSSWTLLSRDGDLTAASPSSTIQFMFEFVTIGWSCIPGRIFSIAVLYEDLTTDSHYEFSASLSDINNKRFAWRFTREFNTTVPALSVQLFDVVAGGPATVTDNTTSPSGTWEKSTDGGTNWGSYDTNDKTNETTYIRYTRSSLSNNLRISALLTRL